MEDKRYKVLIADDEYWTREKLRRMIRWEEYSLECLKPAENGEEVLQRMEEEQPDILITDINMPYVNGVDLLREIQQNYPDVIAFVISGYDDFDYVKDSFLAGSVNYLLKPVNKIDLVNALSKALEKISEKQSRRQELQKMASLIQDREFSRLLEKKDVPLMPGTAMGSREDLNGASLMLVKIHNMQELARKYSYDQYLISWAVKSKLQELTGEKKGILVFNYIYRSNEFLILVKQDYAKTDLLALKILNYFKENIESPVTVVLSGQVYSLDTMYQIYAQMIAALMTRKFSPENQLIKCDEQSTVQNRRIEARFGDRQVQELKQILRKKKGKEAKAYIREQIRLEDRSEQWTYLDMRQTVKKIVNVIQEQFSESMDAQTAVDLENFADLADRTAGMLDLDGLCEILDEIVDYVSSLEEISVADTTRELVKQAAAYIDAHYYEDLTLVSLAERFYVESSYFSRLFRQEMGETVMLYIAGTRIRHAMQYICESEKSLTEIAVLTGYDDYTYFNRVFRKMTGVSPREYRSQHRPQS